MRITSQRAKVRRTKVRRTAFSPRTSGIFILLIIVLAFTVGTVRQEMSLFLAGAVFFALWAYTLLMTLLLALIHRQRSRRAFIRISPRDIAAGNQVEAQYCEADAAAFKGAIVQLPGILVRCRLELATKDRRRIIFDFNPAAAVPHFFTVKKRGAYFSVCNEFAIFDILGFFRFAYRLPAENPDSPNAAVAAQILAAPHAANEPQPVNARAGESSLKPEFSFQRTDNLIDHRPYIPGDDPRRINWKLYGHGGGLFVRDGEREPPAQSHIVILIDAEYDPLLYDIRSARHGIDVLCENALAMALACTESGMRVLTGYSGSVIREGNLSAALAADLAISLALPAALPLPSSLEMPAVPVEYGIAVFALPRSTTETSMLDRFLKNTAQRNAGKIKSQTIELLFFCDTVNERLYAAETCAVLYNQRPGVKVRIMRNENEQ